MAPPRGVSCPRCGASTPLPDDLRVPSFACAFCHATLDTAQLAGQAAVSAEALLGHMQNVAANPPTDIAASVRSAPQFQGGSTESRPAPCKHCGATLAVPLDLQTRELTCGACSRTQLVRDYISDQERFVLDMQRQVAGNDAFAKLKQEGVPCGKCGAKNPVPDDGSVQVTCAFCGAAILLSDHVDASAVARQRLKHGAYAMRDELRQQAAAKQKKTTIVVLVIVALVIAIVLGVNLLGRL